MEVAESYVKRFAKLRTDTSPARWPATTCYRAPYKPFLLLAIIDLIAQGLIQTNFIEFSADLIDTFDLYWDKVVGQEKASNPVLPFFHLYRDDFWHLVPVPGKEQALADIPQIRSIGPLRQLVLGATLDEDLFEMLLNKESRDDLRRVLIETYFAPEVRSKLVELGQISAEAFQYSLELLGRSRGRFKTKLKESSEDYYAVSRSTAFRRVVVKAYDFTCAMCRIRIFTPEGQSAVIAAHIVPWSESYNDDPRNGIALCGLHHWTLDQGVVGVTPDYHIEVSPAVPTNEEGTEPLLSMAGRMLYLPAERTLWPAKKALKWHWENIFCAEAPSRLL
jgi:putative restriction endonuclease